MRARKDVVTPNVISNSYSESFMNFLRSKEHPNSRFPLQVRLEDYLASNEFKGLNESCGGNGLIFLGEAIKELLNTERIFYKIGFYILNK